MPEQHLLHGFTGKKGPATYKAAKGRSGHGNFGNIGQKPAKKQRISSVDKKVKRVSNKIMRYKSVNPGSPAYDTHKVI